MNYLYPLKFYSRSPSSKEPDDNEEDSIDKKDLDKNRKQDAVEEDDISESDDDISNTTSPSGSSDDDEPLTDDLKIPFFYNYSNEIGIDLFPKFFMASLTTPAKNNSISQRVYTLDIHNEMIYLWGAADKYIYYKLSCILTLIK